MKLSTEFLMYHHTIRWIRGKWENGWHPNSRTHEQANNRNDGLKSENRRQTIQNVKIDENTRRWQPCNGPRSGDRREGFPFERN
jgi:hypothetical protein